MKRLVVFGAMLALVFALAGVTRADTVTDTTLNVTYTATVSGTQVTLTIDATGFSQGTGFLTAVAMQFPGASTVTLVSAPGGVAAWSSVGPGGLDSGGCNGKGTPFSCIQNLSANEPVPASGTYTFVFSAPGLNSDTSDIKAAYNAASDNSGQNLGLTSMGIDLTPKTPTPTPEPASILLLGFGLAGAPFLRRRRS